MSGLLNGLTMPAVRIYGYPKGPPNTWSVAVFRNHPISPPHMLHRTPLAAGFGLLREYERVGRRETPVLNEHDSEDELQGGLASAAAQASSVAEKSEIYDRGRRFRFAFQER